MRGRPVGVRSGVIERLRRFADRVPEPAWPAVLGSCLFVYLSVTAIAQWRTGKAGPDLAYFTEALTDISSGESPFLSLYGLHLLGDHTNLFLWTLAPFAAVLPVIPVLLVAQAAAASIALWPLWLILRRRMELPFGFVLCLLGAYALHPSVQNANMAGFHLDPFAVPFLAGAVYFALSPRRTVSWGYWLCVAGALSTREEVAVIVVVLGGLLALHSRRLGIITAGVATGWYALQYFLVKSAFAGGTELARGRLSQYGGDSLAEVLRAWFQDPATYARRLLAADTVLLAIIFLAPLAFIPLLHFRWVLPGLALQGIFLLSGEGWPRAGDGHYGATLVPFLVVAAGAALAAMQPRPPLSLVTRLIIGGAVLSWGAFSVSNVFQWKDLRSRSPHEQTRFDAVAMVPDGAVVSASQRISPLLADRAEVYSWPLPWDTYPGYEKDPVPVAMRRASVEWLVLDTADATQWLPEMAQALPRIAPGQGFTLVWERDGIKVYRRGPGTPGATPVPGSD